MSLLVALYCPLELECLRLMLHWATFWAMLPGSFERCCRQRATRWDTGLTTDLKYPDGIFQWESAQATLLKKNCPAELQKHFPVYNQPNSMIKKHLGYLCNPRSPREATETSRPSSTVTDVAWEVTDWKGTDVYLTTDCAELYMDVFYMYIWGM